MAPTSDEVSFAKFEIGVMLPIGAAVVRKPGWTFRFFVVVSMSPAPRRGFLFVAIRAEQGLGPEASGGTGLLTVEER
jgi:hypothetical protein